MASDDGIVLGKVQERGVGEIENTLIETETFGQIGSNDECCQNKCTSKNVRNKIKIDINFDPKLIEKYYYNLDDFKKNTINKICKDEVYPNIECGINEENNCITIVGKCNKQELDEFAHKVDSVICQSNDVRKNNRVAISRELGFQEDLNDMTWLDLNEWIVGERIGNAVALHACGNDSQIADSIKGYVKFCNSSSNMQALCNPNFLCFIMRALLEVPEQALECKDDINLVMNKLLETNCDYSENMCHSGKIIYKWLYENAQGMLGEYYVSY